MTDAQLCRLCARQKPLLVDITSEEDGGALVDLIGQYLSLKIVSEDKLPKVVCTECSDILMSFHGFATRCQEAQASLLETLRVKVELLKLEDAARDGGDLLKNENIKEEKEDKDADFDIEDFDYSIDYEEWVPSVADVPLQIKKKKGRKPKLRITTRSSTLSFYENYETKEIKTEDGVDYPKKKNHVATKRHKRKMQQQCSMKIKRPCSEMFEINFAPLSCYVCGDNDFSSRTCLKDHERSHLVLDKKFQWPCPKCDKTFKVKNIALRHVQLVHEDNAGYICHACGHQCTSKGGLKAHLISHTEVRPYQCDKCHKRFKGKPSLKRHMDTHRDTAYQCPKCAQLLNSRVTLRNHLLTHDEVGRQECHLCDKKFKSRKSLKVHLRIHTGERPYSCPWCPKTFANNSNCRIHKKRVHMPELMKFEAERAAKHSNQSETSELDQRYSTHSTRENFDHDLFDDEPLIKLKDVKSSSRCSAYSYEIPSFSKLNEHKATSSALTPSLMIESEPFEVHSMIKSGALNSLIIKKL